MADRMKRASYREAIRWIAYQDDPASTFATDPGEVGGMVSTVLTADLFGVDAERVARDVIRVRQSKEWRVWARKEET